MDTAATFHSLFDQEHPDAKGDIRAPPELVGDDPFRGPFGLGVGADMRIAVDPVKEECVVARLHAQDETDGVVAEVFDVGAIGG